MEKKLSATLEQSQYIFLFLLLQWCYNFQINLGHFEWSKVFNFLRQPSFQLNLAQLIHLYQSLLYFFETTSIKVHFTQNFFQFSISTIFLYFSLYFSDTT